MLLKSFLKLLVVILISLFLQKSNLANFLDRNSDGPQIEVSDTLLSFGTVYTDTVSTISITILNIGNDLLNIDSIVTNSPNFQTSINITTIIPGGSGELQVTFSPDDEKLYEHELHIYSNDSLRSPKKLYLLGSGKIKKPRIYLSREKLSFGLVEANKTKIEQFYIKNVGLADLMLSQITFEEIETPFSFTSPDSKISPNDSVFIDVMYKYESNIRQIENDFLNKIIIFSNDPFVTSSKIDLSATTYRRIYVPEYYKKIQDGIDSTWYNDTLIISPGIYYENLKIRSRNIVLASEYLFTKDTSIISNTIIDGNSLGNTVYFYGNTDLIEFTGFTIMNGEAHLGGGIYIDYGSNCKISDLIVSNNKANHGGGIYSGSTNVEISNIVISNNDGGGIELNGSAIHFKDFIIENNINGSGLTNGAYNSVISDGIIRNNNAFAGGGLSALESKQIYKNIKIEDNSALDFGGGIINFGVDNIFDGIKVLNNKTLTDQPGYGGGIHCEESSPIIQNCLIAGNIGFSGGGISAFFGNPVIINSTIVNNIDSSADPNYSVGGGLYCAINSSPILINSIFWNNTSPEINFHMVMEEDIISIANSIIKGGLDSIFTYQSIGNIYALGGNVSLDPLFIDEANGDYRLKETSPAIGAGIDSIQIKEKWYNSPFTDLENNSRPNPIGSKPDIGAYENESGVISDIEKFNENIAKEYKLHQNYPNPFNPNTKIKFSVIKQENVELNVYNILGKKVLTILNKELSAGSYTVNFNAEKLNSGVYFYRIETPSFNKTKKLLLLK